MYGIIFKKSAEKEIIKLPIQAVKRISTAIDNLSSNPRPAGAKKLEGQKESLWRIRVWRLSNYLLNRRTLSKLLKSEE